MHRKLLLLGSVAGLLAVILGAFGAHGLEKLVDASAIQIFETGVRYQFYHAFLALLIGGFSFFSTKTKTILFYLLLTGILLFSGSIYGLATNNLTSFDFTSLALLTPLGGSLLILAWLIVVINILKIKMK